MIKCSFDPAASCDLSLRLDRLKDTVFGNQDVLIPKGQAALSLGNKSYCLNIRVAPLLHKYYHMV